MIGSCREPVWKGLKDSLKKDETESYSNNCFSSIQIFIFQALHNSGDGHISNFMRQQRRGKEGKGRRDLLALFSPSPLPFLRLLRRLLSLDFLKLLRIANEYAAEGKIYKRTDQQKVDTLNSAKLIVLSES